MGLPIDKIAVLGGGGVIGSGFAVNFAWKNMPVVIYDISAAALETARTRVSGALSYLAAQGVISPADAQAALGRITYTTDVAEAVKDAGFIQEAVLEQYAVKKELLALVDRHTSPTAIFASSTSGLLISEIARDSKHPERCVGAHPYNPPYLIPLIEVAKGEKTSDEAAARTMELYRSIGKEPILLQKEALGFIANRLQIALYREVVEIVKRGICSVEDVDKALCFGPGLRFALMGANMIFQLAAGPYGIKGALHHMGPSAEMWLADMADWKKFPEGWGDQAQEGVNAAMANRPADQGRTTEEIAKWRDEGLIMLLKYLKKI